jgi:predicted permease
LSGTAAGAQPSNRQITRWRKPPSLCSRDASIALFDRLPALAALHRDLGLGLRLVARAPGFSAIAILTLALGIGANAAIFSVFEQMLVRPLPVHAPRDLVNFGAPGPKPGFDQCNQAGDCDQVFSYPMFQDLARVQTSFAGVAAHRVIDVNLAAGNQTTSGFAALVSGSYFSVLGLTPALGRLIGPADDDVIGEAAVAVLTHDYWRRHFNADPLVVNKTLLVNGQLFTIVGVTPERFSGTTLGLRPQLFVPLTMRGVLQPGFDYFTDRRGYWLYLFGRLQPGISPEQARTEMNGRYQAILREVEAPLQTGMSGETLARFKAKPIILSEGFRGQSSLHQTVTAPLTLLLAVAALVLIIACANTANLLLVRAAGRAGEMAVRLSIGGSRRQLIRQLLTESCVLAAFAGVAALLVAYWTLGGINLLLPSEVSGAVDFSLDPTALFAAAILALGTGLVVGVVPALHATRPDLLTVLKDQSGQPSGARKAARVRTALATMQMALAMTLLILAGLFTRSLANVGRIDLGLDAERVITFGLAPGFNGYSPDRSRAFFERVEHELASLPGVTAASASLVRVLSGNTTGGDLRVERFVAGPDGNVNARFHEIGPDFFRTMGMTLLAGRPFTPADADTAPKVAIVNEAFATKFNLGGDAIGRRVGKGRTATDLDIEIIGIVKNAKYSDVKQAAPPVMFLPYRQNPRLFGMNFYVRTASTPDLALAAIPQLVAGLDPNVPVRDLMTLPQQIGENVFLDRLVSILSASFAVLATLLAAVGLYAVLAYTVFQRTREIALRMALGAEGAQVRGMILRQVAIMTVVGGSVGVVAASALGMAAGSLLFQLDGFDLPIVLISALLLSAVALTAAVFPARHAARIDPMRALRSA